MLTAHLASLSGQQIIPEVTNHSYSMFNDGSTECEVGEFLHGLVRVLKPQRILETGTYKGWSSSYMAQALRENGFGHLDTIEYEPKHIQTSKELWAKLGIQEWITEFQMPSLEFQPQGFYDFVFLDTEPQIRFAELENFYPFVSPGGFMAIHDLPRDYCQGNINPDHPEIKSYPFGDVPFRMKDLLETGKLLPFAFPSPRGFALFYKPHPKDYRP